MGHIFPVPSLFQDQVAMQFVGELFEELPIDKSDSADGFRGMCFGLPDLCFAEVHTSVMRLGGKQAYLNCLRFQLAGPGSTQAGFVCCQRERYGRVGEMPVTALICTSLFSRLQPPDFFLKSEHATDDRCEQGFLQVVQVFGMK